MCALYFFSSPCVVLFASMTSSGPRHYTRRNTYWIFSTQYFHMRNWNFNCVQENCRPGNVARWLHGCGLYYCFVVFLMIVSTSRYGLRRHKIRHVTFVSNSVINILLLLFATIVNFIYCYYFFVSSLVNYILHVYVLLFFGLVN